MTQAVWHKNDIANQAQAIMNIVLTASHDPEFVSGAYCVLAALCLAFDAPVPRLPERRIEIEVTYATEITGLCTAGD